MRNLVLLIIAFIGLVIFLVTIGFKLLINSTLFLNNIGSKEDTNETQTDEDFIGTVDIDNIPTATNSARFVLSGSVTNYDTVDMYINRKKVKSVKLLNTGSFSEEIGDLQKGDNLVYVVVKATKEKKQKKSETHTVIYNNEKPKLEVRDLQDGSKVYKSELKVTGSADKGNEVTVNGFPVVIDQNGNFETTINLREGDNTVEVQVQDEAGNTEKKTFKVTYQKD